MTNSELVSAKGRLSDQSKSLAKSGGYRKYARIVEGSGVILLATLGVSLVCKALAED